eukprot:6479216-Amphidinium_carterae.1
MFVVLHDCTGMCFGPKSKFLLIGRGGRAPFMAALRRLGRGHLLEHVPVVDKLRWLGISLCLSPGQGFDPHECMVNRMEMKPHRLTNFGHGAAAGIFMAKASIYSVATHTLCTYTRTTALESIWERCASAAFPGHSKWLKPARPFLRKLFGLPANLPPLQATELWLHCHHLLKLQVDVSKLRDDVRWLGELGLDPLQSWRNNGIIASLHRSFLHLEANGIIRYSIEGGITQLHLACTTDSMWDRLLRLQGLSIESATHALQAKWDGVSRGE